MPLKYLQRKFPLVMVVILLGSCGAASESPGTVQIIENLPQEQISEIEGVLQCRAELISQGNDSESYRSIYFLIGLDGSETVQSIIEGVKPCP